MGAKRNEEVMANFSRLFDSFSFSDIGQTGSFKVCSFCTYDAFFLWSALLR